MSPQRIALFGGSFDPPHLGHVLAACYARVVAQVDEVWVMPVAKHAYNKPISSWEQRWRLCETAFAALPFVRLCDDERDNAGGYTIDLIELLTRKHPHHHWLLVGGTDTARDLINWHRGADLIKLIEVIPVPRRGYDEHPAALPQISSSLIRERLARNEDISQLVPPAVAELIRAQQGKGKP
jgi:nicotinate-nucleotide adenylyltransferase